MGLGALNADSLANVTEKAVRVDPPVHTPGAYDPQALYVALYGFPGSSTLGALGEQPLQQTVDRAVRLAERYVGLGRPVVPAFELIGSVASAFAGSDGDYSNEFPPELFLPWIDAAEDNGFHVLIDLQSGRARFPDQAREYAELWRRPNVSMALDPEWRVRAPQTPGGGTIGTVDAAEVNETTWYLDELTRSEGLPPKLLVLHQFDPSMITDKSSIAGTDRVQVVMHMDGFGTLARKRGSWGRMVADLPPGSRTGWKNFFDEDSPTPTPAETLDNTPTPMWVSYQ